MFEVFLRYVHPSRWHRVEIVTYRFSIFSWGCKQSNLSSFVFRPQIYNFLFIAPNADSLFVLFCAVCATHLGLGSFFSLQSKCCVLKSDVMFWWKRRLVLWKMTCCFDENNVSFYGKWRLVFNARWEGQKTRGETELKNWVCGKVKIHIIIPSRAYAYARITGVFVFLLSQVSQAWR